MGGGEGGVLWLVCKMQIKTKKINKNFKNKKKIEVSVSSGPVHGPW